MSILGRIPVLGSSTIEIQIRCEPKVVKQLTSNLKEWVKTEVIEKEDHSTLRDIKRQRGQKHSNQTNSGVKRLTRFSSTTKVKLKKNTHTLLSLLLKTQ